MPHTSSAWKSLRKSEKRRNHNRIIKKTLRTYLKRFQLAITGPVDVLQSEFNMAAKKLDKAAVRNIIHKNLAARKKSQMAKVLHKKLAEAKAAGTPASGTAPTTPPKA
jgi:small subunit ribosomal protein S20